MHTTAPLSHQAVRRVAGYARVSTDTEEKQTCYDAQMDYYKRFISEHEEWRYIGLYSGEGISRTSIKKRKGFQKMITDALDGKGDLIVTKSISRFARNTVDSSNTVRQLKAKGIEVFFEKDGLWTFDPSAELTITILSSIAQEESRNLSTNVTWGQRKRFADGKVSMPYKRFLGYDRSEDGEPVVNEEQAELVRRIYAMCINGFTPHAIAGALTQEGVPTRGGKTVWQTNVIESILTNEKYKGDALLQKTFCTDYLTKKMKVNEGEVPSYYVKNSHPPIVSAELFDHVQRELEHCKGLRCVVSAGCFAGHVICGDCGGLYSAKVWHSNSKYRRTVWRCNKKYEKDNKKCCTPHFYEDQLKAMFVQIMNERFTHKDEIIASYKETIDDLTSNRQFDAEQKRLQTEIDIVLDMMHRMVLESARVAQNQSEYRERYGVLVERHDGVKAQLDEVERQIMERNAKRSQLEQALTAMKKCKGVLTGFGEELWYAVIDKLIVHDSERISFVFKDGSENEWRG